MNKKRKEEEQAFITQTQALLKDKGYGKDCYPLKQFIQSIFKHEKNTSRKVFLYKWSGFIFLISIPLISASLSFSISGNSNSAMQDRMIVLILSVLLTFLTILNSVLRPSERFSKACKIAIEMDQFKCDLFVGLERLDKITETAILEYVQKKRLEFKQFREQLIELFLPEKA